LVPPGCRGRGIGGTSRYWWRRNRWQAKGQRKAEGRWAEGCSWTGAVLFRTPSDHEKSHGGSYAAALAFQKTLGKLSREALRCECFLKDSRESGESPSHDSDPARQGSPLGRAKVARQGSAVGVRGGDLFATVGRPARERLGRRADRGRPRAGDDRHASRGQADAGTSQKPHTGDLFGL